MRKLDLPELFYPTQEIPGAINIERKDYGRLASERATKETTFGSSGECEINLIGRMSKSLSTS